MALTIISNVLSSSKLFYGKKIGLFFIALLIMALGHPALMPSLCVLSSTIGFSLFYRWILDINKKFIGGFFFFALIQAIQLQWLVTTKYHGYTIVLAYLLLVGLIGLQGGIFSWLIGKIQIHNLYSVFALSSIWTLFEWIRLFFFSGFAWNQIGIFATFHPLFAQLASIGGIYFLTFYVCLLSGTFYLVWMARSKYYAAIFFSLVMFPILFGSFRFYMDKKKTPSMDIALIQTGLQIEQRSQMGPYPDSFIHPLIQWHYIFQMMKDIKKIDLFVLPEAALPYSSNLCVYDYDQFIHILSQSFTRNAIENALPILRFPYAKKKETDNWKISNLYIVQTLSNLLDADGIIGLDHYDADKKGAFNSAFFVRPFESDIETYHKQKLIPIAEYLPLSHLKSISEKYGIFSFFVKGKESVVFEGRYRYAPSICYDDCFPSLIKKSASLSPHLLVNITNDGWFPFSSLPKAHYIQGKLRAIEQGLPLVRSCNSGITAIVDHLGREIAQLPDRTGDRFYQGVLVDKVFLTHTSTLYAKTGDGLIICICFLSIGFFISYKNKNQNSAC